MTPLSRRSLLAAAATAPFIAQARAQSFPPPTVKIVSPFPPGGSSDAIARLIQPGFQQRLGANVIIENRPGASASIGATVVAKSPADGATWLFTADTFLVAPLLLANVPFDVEKDFVPVTMVARGAIVVCTHPSRPYHTLADVAAAAKERPGVITYATTGTGGIGHLTMAAATQRLGMKLVHVPYRGIGPANNDAIAGHVDLILSSTASLAPQIMAGQLRPIAQFGETRARFLPDLPTVKEAGLLDFSSYSWFGWFGPAGTPSAIVERVYNDIVATVREPAIMDTLLNKYSVEVPLLPPAELRKEISEKLAMWTAVIRDNNIKGGS